MEGLTAPAGCAELGYGDGGSGSKIKGGDVLIFRMEILKIKVCAPPATQACNIIITQLVNSIPPPLCTKMYLRAQS